MLLSLSAALAAAAVYGGSAVLQGVALRRESSGHAVDAGLLLALLRNPLFLVALGLNLLGFGLHLLALRELPLFLVQAAIASSIAVTAVLAGRLLHIPLTAAQWVAVAAVCLGLSVLAHAAVTGGAARLGGGLEAGLLLGILGLAVAGMLVARVPRALGSALLGLIAGAGFGIVGVAARLLPALSPGAVVRSPATYILVLSGIVGFVLYLAAMQHGSVTTATAALVVTQTSVPALIGALLLGDEVRPGWAPAAVLGLLLALAGAAALARGSQAPEVAVAAG